MTLSEEAYKVIKEKILFSAKKNRHLSVRKTSDELDMSYTPVREAFTRLEREGLLERIPKVGYLIPEINNKDIEEIFQLRECLETFVLKKVFDLLTEEHIKKLQGFIQAQKDALQEEDVRKFYDNDKYFHLTFFEVYNNSHMIDIIKNVRDRYLVCSLTTIIGGQSGIAAAISEHEELAANISNGNKKKAVKNLIDHVHDSKVRLKQGNIYMHD